MAKSYPVSPLASPLPELGIVSGVKIAALEAGIRYKNRKDLMMMVFAPHTVAAGVYTKNKCPGAPIDWCRSALEKGKGNARALIVNSGNANVFTGKAGLQTTTQTAEKAASLLNCQPEEIFISSTGVIGEILPEEKITTHLPTLAIQLQEGSWEDAARAIMTTDTFPKAAIRTITLEGKTITLQGIAKGSGMIAPDMATMLCYVATDAAITAEALQAMLNHTVTTSFNAITVDSDTSTSDTLMVFATQQAGNSMITNVNSMEAQRLQSSLHDILHELALMVVSDGEGASKLFEVSVSGAHSDHSAHKVAMAIGNSPLVKTAIAGEDPNWGRIAMAVGKSGEPADRDKLSIAIGGVTIAKEGSVVEDYNEAPVAKHMKGTHIHIAVDLGLGAGKSRIWSCDLTHGYIDINGSYRS